jgi:hypothetical protein
MFLTLDFLYVPAPDFEATLSYYRETLGGELVWKVRGMGTVVANVRLSASGPAILISEHLTGKTPILIYRVPDYQAAVAQLKANGARGGEEVEIPHGPCFSFTAHGGQRLAVYELVRPEADAAFAGRFDS